MKKNELILLYKALSTNTNTDSIKFNYGVNKNLRIISDEIDSLRATEEEMEKGIEQYKVQQKELYIKFGEETDKGILIKQDMIDEFNKEMQELNDKFNEEIKKYENDSAEYKTILSEDIEDFNFFAIPGEHLPSHNLNPVDNIPSLNVLMKYNIVE